jgi:hypothetical protein
MTSGENASAIGGLLRRHLAEHHPQYISTQKLVDTFLRVAAAYHRLSEERPFGRYFNSLRLGQFESRHRQNGTRLVVELRQM